jgi:hypothetical protein
MSTATAFGDSCLEDAGGYLISLGYWWHLPFPKKVIQRTLVHKKDNKDGLLILINILELVTVILTIVHHCTYFLFRSVTTIYHKILQHVKNILNPMWEFGLLGRF